MNKNKKISAFIIAATVLTGVAAAPAASADNVNNPTTYTKLPVNPKIAAAPAGAQTIKDLAVQNNELYLGYGDTLAAGRVDVTSMNLTTTKFTNWVTTPNKEINNFRIINNKLFAPTTTPMPTTSATDKVGFATNYFGSWSNQAVTQFKNVYDIATSNGTDLWLAGTVVDSTGRNYSAVIKRSVDGGKTWTTEKTVQANLTKSTDGYYWLASAGGKIYAKPRLATSENNTVDVWSNGKWSTITENPRTAINATLAKASQVAVIKGNIIISQGSTFTTIDSNKNTITSGYNPAGRSIDFYSTSDELYVLGDKALTRTTDGVTWQIVHTDIPLDIVSAARSVAVYNSNVYIAGTKGSVWKAKAYNQ